MAGGIIGTSLDGRGGVEEEEEEGEATTGEIGVGGEVDAVNGGVGGAEGCGEEGVVDTAEGCRGLREAALVAVAPR